MMKAEVTAENRPAFHPSQYACIRVTHETHKYQGGVQVLVILLDELFVIVLRLLAIYFIEVCPVIPCGRRRDFALACVGVSTTVWRDMR